MAGEVSAMGGEVENIGIAEVRSALAWWLEAGIDAAIQEEPRNWLKPVAPAVREQKPSPEPAAEQPVHATLDEFREWLATSEHLPMASRAARRVLPQGREQAAVMLLAEAPEDSSGPLGGEAWELAKRMLAAIHIPVDEAYSAALSFFHAPGARMSAAERDASAEIARRHIRLAAPRRLILFGDGPALALLGKRLIDARGHVHKVEGVRTVATFHPRHLVNRPLDKSLAWQDLLLLMEDES
jgi:uracil-DNA glycosylase family 4